MMPLEQARPSASGSQKGLSRGLGPPAASPVVTEAVVPFASSAKPFRAHGGP